MVHKALGSIHSTGKEKSEVDVDKETIAGLEFSPWEECK